VRTAIFLALLFLVLIPGCPKKEKKTPVPQKKKAFMGVSFMMDTQFHEKQKNFVVKIKENS
jgi:hypothetical protein